MAEMLVGGYPVTYILIGDQVDTDDFGPILSVREIRFSEFQGARWEAEFEHPGGARQIGVNQNVVDQSSGNIPPPQRFRTDQLAVKTSLNRTAG